MEDIKQEQLLMVTFSRAAATEFKKRLIKLIGNAANYFEMRYVGITRAKRNLKIHTNSKFLDNFFADNLTHIEDNG